MKSAKLFMVTTSALLVAAIHAADQPQWGQRYTRNMVSGETGLPDAFDPASGRNVKWIVPLGTSSYGTPIIAGGKVFIGTNNDRPRNPVHKGDRGVLYCLNEADGKLCWQLVVPKLTGDKYLDWPRAGICSPPTVDGDRVYVVTNRGEVACLDINGLADGNDGPFKAEAEHATPEGEATVSIGETDADIVWLFDMRKEVALYCHDSAHTSILVDGPYLYLNTGNGVDNTHRKIRSPDAPVLIVLDKKTGRLVAKENEGIAPVIFHCSWSSPAVGEVGGNRLIFYGGPNGVCYAFRALPESVPDGPAQALEKLWWFDCDPTAPKTDVHRFIGNRKESPSVIHSMPVFHQGLVYVTVGGDMWWGKRQSWLKCVDPNGTGDITKSGERWSYPMAGHNCTTPAVHDGLIYVGDCSRTVHCVDAETGQACWTHQVRGPVWGSTLVADGKVFVGTRGKQFIVFKAGREKRVLSTVMLDSQVSGTPTAANGVLYIPTMQKLYAIAKTAP